MRGNCCSDQAKNASTFGLLCVLARGKPQIGRLARDLAFDVAERADPVQGFAGDLGVGCRPDVMEVTPQMRPTRRLTEPGGPVWFRFVAFGMALAAVRRANDPPDRLLIRLTLKDAAGLPEMLVDVVFLPVRGEAIERPRRCSTRPGALAIVIIREISGVARHATGYRRSGRSTMKPTGFRRMNHPTRAGGAPPVGFWRSTCLTSVPPDPFVGQTIPRTVYLASSPLAHVRDAAGEIDPNASARPDHAVSTTRINRASMPASIAPSK